MTITIDVPAALKIRALKRAKNMWYESIEDMMLDYLDEDDWLLTPEEKVLLDEALEDYEKGVNFISFEDLQKQLSHD